MAIPQLYNLVRMSTATSGTGTITLGSAITGFRSFASASVPNGATVRYAIADPGNAPTQREWGTGVYNSGTNTLTRVLGGSSTGSLLNLSGSAHVFITAMAEDVAPASGSITLTASATSTVKVDARCDSTSHITFTAKTAHAAACVATMYYTPGNGTFTVYHANNAYTDKDFSYVISN